MQIKQLLASGRTFSFEFSVPRTAKAEARLRRTVAELAPINPSFVSVTYGAAGSSREQTRETVLWLLRDARLTTMPHLTCIAQSRQEVIDILTEYREAGFGNLLALHGDPPRDNPGIEEGDFHYAIELVELARELTEFSIGVATHPEGHPAAPDTVSDREHQAAKLRVADFGITQFSFEAKHYLRLMDDMAARGVDTPIIAGVIPVTNVNEVKRFADLAGASFPSDFLNRLRAVEDDEHAMRRIGVEQATELCRRLLDEGVPGIHLYTLNRSTAAREIFGNLKIGAA